GERAARPLVVLPDAPATAIAPRPPHAALPICPSGAMKGRRGGTEARRHGGTKRRSDGGGGTEARRKVARAFSPCGCGTCLRGGRSAEHTSELQSREKLVCRLLPENKNPRTNWW